MSYPTSDINNDIRSERSGFVRRAGADRVGNLGNAGGNKGTELRPREGKTTCCVGCIPLVVAALLVPLLTARYWHIIVAGVPSVTHASLGLIVAVLSVGGVMACFSSRRR